MTTEEVARTLHVGLGNARKVRNDLGLETRIYAPRVMYCGLEKVYDAYRTDTPPHAVIGAGFSRNSVARYYNCLRKLDAAPVGKPLTLEEITKSESKNSKSGCRVWLHFLALQGSWKILPENKFQKIGK